MSAIILRRRKLGKGSATGISKFSAKGFTQVRNWIDPFPADTDIVFRWGCTSNVPDGAKVVNDAKAIHWCSDKRQGRLDMQAAGVPVPQTYVRPQDISGDDCDSGVVIRPNRHAQGRNLYVEYGYANIVKKLNALGYREGSYYLSSLIPKVAEYRVFVVQNRVAWVAKKTPGNPDQVAWNVAQGGRFDNVRWDEWPKAVVQAALAAAKVGGIDFGGVDVMVDADGNPYVLEVNSAPSQTSEYRQSCVAKAFDYIIENGKKPFEDVADSPRRTYKSYIHPAVRGNAD